jgi:predicted Zn-dependent peptidase
LNSMSSIANGISSQSFGEVNLFDYQRLLQNVSFEDVQTAARQLFDPEAVASLIIYPTDGEEA